MRKYRRNSPTDTKVREEEVPQVLEDSKGVEGKVVRSCLTSQPMFKMKPPSPHTQALCHLKLHLPLEDKLL